MKPAMPLLICYLVGSLSVLLYMLQVQRSTPLTGTLAFFGWIVFTGIALVAVIRHLNHTLTEGATQPKPAREERTNTTSPQSLQSLGLEEFLENLQEIGRLQQRKRLRKYLRFVLVGFFIGGDVGTATRKCVSRNQSIIQTLATNFHDMMQANGQFEELIFGFEIFGELQRGLDELGKQFGDVHNLASELESELGKQHEAIRAYLESLIRQKGDRVNREAESILNSGSYMMREEKQSCIESIKSFEESLAACKVKHVLNDDTIEDLLRKSTDLHQRVLSYNADFVQQRKRDYGHLWKTPPLQLDDEQQTAIVTDDKHNLVIAAAGSGKTEILTTRIAYLINRKPDTVDAQKILAIAYQRKAMEEIEQRLSERFNIRNVVVRTFHKLGKDILAESGNHFVHADIVNENKKHEIIDRIFKHKIRNDPNYYQLFLDFVRTLHDREVDEEYEDRARGLAYARERPYFAINNVQVNSRAEKEIMDFFLTHKLNGRVIKIRYEPDIGGFRPDFHLPEYDLFLEHWGLTKDGEVPEWFSETTKKYKQAMEMKREWFRSRHRVLVETFAYEYKENHLETFFDILKSRIISALQKNFGGEFVFTLRSYEEILDVAWQSYRTPTDDIKNFITIAKTYGLGPADISGKLQTGKWLSKQITFGNLVLPVYYAYEDTLHGSRKTDFEDMINQAIAKLDEDPSLRTNLYDHILIDEYQDISAQRYRLIKRLMDRNPSCRLFCVGDDWQSIMGFSGSNLNFFVNFDQYFANPVVSKISTNYRSNKTIVDAGAALIQNNTNCQIQKPTQSHNPQTRPIRILKDKTQNYESEGDLHSIRDCLGRIQHHLHNGCSPNDILVLSRCMRTRVQPHGYKFLSYIESLINEAEESEMQLAYDRVHANDKVRLLTVHRSKGLEAKVIFLLNVTEDTFGFPCRIEDPVIYDPARENYPPQDPLEEERRLFYVAITRAKQDLYIYTREAAISKFLDEIADYTVEEPPLKSIG